MFKTRITELFGIEHPIVGGCMMHISGPEFVAAISDAGALGIMASAMFDTQDKFREAVRRMLPKSKLGRKMLSKLKLYAGPDHPHQAQRPQPRELGIK